MKLVYEDDTTLIYVYDIDGDNHIEVIKFPNKERKDTSKALHEKIMGRWLK